MTNMDFSLSTNRRSVTNAQKNRMRSPRRDGVCGPEIRENGLPAARIADAEAEPRSRYCAVAWGGTYDNPTACWAVQCGRVIAVEKGTL